VEPISTSNLSKSVFNYLTPSLQNGNIYHIVWILKYRKKKFYEELRKYLGEVFKELARQKECEVMEGHLGIVYQT
jgi:putative transposase